MHLGRLPAVSNIGFGGESRWAEVLLAGSVAPGSPIAIFEVAALPCWQVEQFAPLQIKMSIQGDNVSVFGDLQTEQAAVKCMVEAVHDLAEVLQQRLRLPLGADESASTPSHREVGEALAMEQRHPGAMHFEVAGSV